MRQHKKHGGFSANADRYRTGLRGFGFFIILLTSFITQANPIWINSFGSSILLSPVGVAFTKTGNILVASRMSIQKFDSVGNYLGVFNNSDISNPYYIAVDNSDNVVVSYPSGTPFLRTFNTSGEILSTFDVTTLPNVALTTRPLGVATYGSNQGAVRVVADNANNLVWLFDNSWNVKASFGGTGTANGLFKNIRGVALDSTASQIVAADTGNYRVQIFDGSDYTFKKKFGGPYYESGGMYSPNQVAVAANGNIVLADDQFIKIYNNDSVQISTFVSDFNSIETSFQNVWGIAVANNGNILVTSSNTNRVHILFDPTLWTTASTNRLLQLPLNQNLNLDNGYILNVVGNTTLPTNINLTLGAGSGFTTDTLTMQGGVLTDNNNSILSAAININNNNGTFESAPNNNLTLAGNINGTGTLITKNTGKITLSGNNNFNSLLINEGTVELAVNPQTITEISGSGNLSLKGVKLTLGSNADSTYSGIISGTGGLIKQGTGTLILSGANQLGAFTINSGIVRLTNNNQTITDLSGSGALRLDNISLTVGSDKINDNDIVFSGIISGPGNLIKQGNDTLTLTGSNNFNNLIINNGKINLKVNAQVINDLIGAGNLGITDINLTLGTSNNTTFSGSISGSGNMIKQGSGTLTLSGANNFGSLTINAGKISLTDTNQTITNLTGNGSLSLTNMSLTLGMGINSEMNFNGIIFGNGGLVKQGSGNLNLSNANNFGALAINGGTVTLTTTSQTMTDLSGNGNLVLSGINLTLGSARDSTFSGNISGNGSLEKKDSGTLTLAGSTIITGATISGGTLKIPATGSLIGNMAIRDNSNLEMNGGTLSGSILGTDNSTLTISGNFTPTAAITNVQNIHVTNGVFNVNRAVSGTSRVNISEGGIVNLNLGGSLSGNISGLGTFNIYTNYVAPNMLSIGNLNIKPGGSATLSASATVKKVLKLEAGSTLYLKEKINIEGDLINAGSIMNTAQLPQIIEGDFTQSGALNINLLDIDHFGSFQVGGTVNLEGGTLAINLPGNNLNIFDADTFDVITSSKPLNVSSLPSLTFPSSVLLSFTQAIHENTLRITAVRRPLEDINTIPQLDEMCKVLDELRERYFNPDFLAIINALDSQANSESLDDILYQLAPPGMNQSIVETSFRNLPFDFIEHRLGMLRDGIDALQFAHHTFSGKSGYAAGDLLEGNGSYGPMVFGSTKKQNERQNFSGYKAFTAGFGFLGDAPVSDYARLGGALSYTGSSIKQDDAIGNTTVINNVQATIYGSTNYGPLFLDGLFSTGFNNYRGKRNIAITNQTATSNYNAVQYSGKLRGGFSIPFYGLEASPLASVQYTYLSQQGYTEEGANGANLTLNPLKVDALEIGIGGSIADISHAEDVLPEIHALYLYYTKPPKLQMTAEFAEGGPAFVANGIMPARAGMNIGGSLTVMLTDDLFVVGSYDMESKQDSVSHALACKVKWLF